MITNQINLIGSAVHEHFYVRTRILADVHRNHNLTAEGSHTLLSILIEIEGARDIGNAIFCVIGAEIVHRWIRGVFIRKCSNT